MHAATVGLEVETPEVPLFVDFTQHSHRYNTLIKSGNIGDFIAAMTDYAFPCVKCPAGCFAFVDECIRIPFNHFLDWKFDLRFFGADRKYLAGARRDWPVSSLQLEVFRVSPA